MRAFFKNLILFIVFFIFFSEITSRIFHISYNTPRLYKGKEGIIRIYPNQEGYYLDGAHKWYINELGFPGKLLPKSNENLITIIGDSFIQNMMNPDSCRQSSFLRKISPKYNYIEGSRDGAQLLEYFEIAKILDSLNPVAHLMYVNTGDFLFCFSNNPLDVRLDLKNNKVIYSEYQESKLKKFIPYMNFAEYLFRKYNSSIPFNNYLSVNNGKGQAENKFNEDIKKVDTLLSFIKLNYITRNVIFVLHPEVGIEYIDLLEKHELKYFRIKKNMENWEIKNDIHWTCEAHEEIAKQVINYLDNNNDFNSFNQRNTK